MGENRTQKAARIKRHADIIAAITEHGPMTFAEVREAVELLANATLSHMVKIKKLASEPTGGRDKNGNTEFLFFLPNTHCSRVETEKRLRLEDVWPASVPVSTSKPRHIAESHSHSVAVYSPSVLQSGHVNLINLMAG